MTRTSIKAFAPATIANFNVGYDSLGVALNNVGDEIELTINGSSRNKIIQIDNSDNLPYHVDKNCCSIVIKKIQEAQNNHVGVDIAIKKGIASGSGMGSSSASSSVAAYAYNSLLGSPYSAKELVAFAAEGERVACGSAHVDNVAPAILGGIVLAKSSNPDDILELPVIDNLFAVTLFPSITIDTFKSRKILKKEVSLSVFSQQVAIMGSFVMSLYENNLKLFSDSMKDLVVEPTRSVLIPHFARMKKEAYQNNALAFGISGSGPSVFAIAEGNENARKIEKSLKNIYENINIHSQTYINPILKQGGARLI